MKYIVTREGYEGWTTDFEIDSEDIREVAEEFAEKFHDEMDGWEVSWPIIFRFEDMAGQKFLVEVEREARPVFVAVKTHKVSP